jgi:hypothetical protein
MVTQSVRKLEMGVVFIFPSDSCYIVRLLLVINAITSEMSIL